MAARKPDESITNDLVIGPRSDESDAIGEVARLIRAAQQVAVIFDDGKPVVLPESLREGLDRVAGFLAEGSSVAIDPYDDILTTQQAADLLGISRPYLIQLIEERHAIPYEPVGDPGKHRRLRLRDVLAYRDGRAIRATLAGHKELRGASKKDEGTSPLQLARS